MKRGRLGGMLVVTMLATACIPVPIPIPIPLPGGASGGRSDAPVTPWPVSATCPVPARSAQDSATLLSLINAERAKAGLAALALNGRLSTVAHKHACDLAAMQSYAHAGSDGAGLAERLRREGLRVRDGAENTGIGFSSPEAAMRFWMSSPDHRANILSSDVTQIGVGQADGRPRPTWVVNFIRPR